MASESTAFEYAMGLFSVLIGLAVIDVATSFHRLMRHRQNVRWDPLVLCAAVYALCMAVYMWFDLWGVRHFAATRQFLFYVGLVGQFFLLFLAAAASLPDDPAPGTDLKAYYAENRRYFWTLIALFQLGYFLFGVFFLSGKGAHVSPVVVALTYSLMGAPLVIATALIFLKSRIAHWIGIALMFVAMILHYGAARIG